MFSKLLDNRNMHWRVRQIDRNLKRLKWVLKYKFGHKATEEVDRFSMIVVGRNDNYGGDFTDRLKATMDWNYKHLPNCELIYIEWNAIEDRATDTDWIAERYPNSKCFIVPQSIHDKIAASKKMPMMEYYAKNLGIREASNDWLVMINADVFLGPEVFPKMRTLSKEYVYGTHYKNIVWHGEPITQELIDDKARVKNIFCTNRLEAVVGNFVLTHRDNWLKATGYDETLNDIRLGVDRNGLMQLFHDGLKPMVIGMHYHLDHNESAINSRDNATHGNAYRIENSLNIPYNNPDDWGFVKYPKKQVGNNIWQLQEI